MGYTHYWRNNKDFNESQWQMLKESAAAIIAAASEDGIPLKFESDEPHKPALINDECIRFNGRGEEGHETFYLSREADGAFCKTERKPYDAAVVAMLMEAHRVCNWFSWNSDGDNEPEQLDDAKRLLKIASYSAQRHLPLEGVQ